MMMKIDDDSGRLRQQRRWKTVPQTSQSSKITFFKHLQTWKWADDLDFLASPLPISLPQYFDWMISPLGNLLMSIHRTVTDGVYSSLSIYDQMMRETSYCSPVGLERTIRSPTGTVSGNTNARTHTSQVRAQLNNSRFTYSCIVKGDIIKSSRSLFSVLPCVSIRCSMWAAPRLRKLTWLSLLYIRQSRSMRRLHWRACFVATKPIDAWPVSVKHSWSPTQSNHSFTFVSSFLADRTATQYDRLLPAACCPSVCL